MQLPRTAWNNYITKLSQLNKTAANLIEAYLNATGLPGTPAERKALIDYAMALTEKYGTGAAALACEMYDELAIASGVTLPPAEPADIPDYGTVAKTVNGTMKVTDNTRYIASSIGRLVKQAGADTTLKNAKRDRKVTEFAWVPNGDTCSFCIMLASNGWRRMSKNALKNGHAEHIHANCDCEYAVRFDKSMSIEGYDPDKYYQEYVDSGRDVNEMRRIDYAKNKDAINARRRENYALKKANADTDKLTKQWQDNASYKKPSVETPTKGFWYQGKMYEVDGVNVISDHDDDEKRTGELLSKATGKTVTLCPRVTGKYEGVSTPDYIVGNNEKWDKKALRGEGKDALRDAIKKKERQADNFLIDISEWKGSEENIMEQAENVFNAANTRFVNTLVITRGDEILRVIERQ